MPTSFQLFDPQAFAKQYKEKQNKTTILEESSQESKLEEETKQTIIKEGRDKTRKVQEETKQQVAVNRGRDSKPEATKTLKRKAPKPL